MNRWLLGVWGAFLFFGGVGFGYYCQVQERVQVAANRNCEILFPKTVLQSAPAERQEAQDEPPAPPVEKKAVVSPAAQETTNWAVGKTFKNAEGRCAWLHEKNGRWQATRIPVDGESMSFETREQALNFLKAGWCS